MGSSAGLARLLQGLEAAFAGDPYVEITGVAYDSRDVRPGDLFVAVPGFVHDGSKFIPDALRAGAVAVIAEAPAPAKLPVSWARVDDARAALAAVACSFYADPSRKLLTAGVTGTNGKTTVTALLQEILGSKGPTGRWSTTSVRIGTRKQPAPRTTPEAPELQRALRQMVDSNCVVAVIEVSSHSLSLQRVAGTHFDVAVFTNLTPEHLDFHGNMEAYLDAKATLFQMLDPDAPAVINVADAAGTSLIKRTTGRPVTFGWAMTRSRPNPDYGIIAYRPGHKHTEIELATRRGNLTLSTGLIGSANAENVAAAAAAGLELETDPEHVRAAIASFRGEPGRLESVDAGQNFTVLVDFAHTPAALEAALEAARGAARTGRLVVLFGCGGDRDPSKRPMMGRIAAHAADHVIITSDNPRSEDPEAIVAEIVQGIQDAVAVVDVIVDRRAAIEHALSIAANGDCVLIAGKGHETEQILAGGPIPFDDREISRVYLLENHQQIHEASS